MNKGYDWSSKRLIRMKKGVDWSRKVNKDE
jgi:hypothetical protein